eukprot:8864885-Alexandrium_andersonii.AAC.1
MLPSTKRLRTGGGPSLSGPTLRGTRASMATSPAPHRAEVAALRLALQKQGGVHVLTDSWQSCAGCGSSEGAGMMP